MLVLLSIPVRIIEFIAKFMRNEKWYKIPIALIVAGPFVLALTLYHSIRMLAVSFKQMTVLKLDQFGQAKKFDVEHGFKFDRERGWNAPFLIDTDLDPIINTRRSQMWISKVYNLFIYYLYLIMIINLSSIIKSHIKKKNGTLMMI